MKTKQIKLKRSVEQNGITLIALIITVIVLLILAGVTINLTIGNNGIFKTAQKAARNYTDAQNKELADLNSFNNTLAGIIGNGTGENTEQLVTEIALDKITTEIGVGRTKTLTATIEPENANNKNVTWSSSDNNIVTVSNGTITGVALGKATITATAQDGSGKSASCSVDVQMMPGDYVKYDTGISGVKTFRVLYDVKSPYGLQIISDKNLEDVTFGGTDWATGRNSYNNAIATLNEEAMKYLNTTYATDARCVGSNPDNKHAETITTVLLPPNEWSSYTRPAGWKSDDSGCKGSDLNDASDRTAMETAGIWITEESYWLASRNLLVSSSTYDFTVRCVRTDGLRGSISVFGVRSNGTMYCPLNSHGLRPCITLKHNIKVTSGDGTSEATAYTLGI